MKTSGGEKEKEMFECHNVKLKWNVVKIIYSDSIEMPNQ